MDDDNFFREDAHLDKRIGKTRNHLDIHQGPKSISDEYAEKVIQAPKQSSKSVSNLMQRKEIFSETVITPRAAVDDREVAKREEDVKAMLEMQCLVIEDLLLKQRFSRMQGPPPAQNMPERSSMSLAAASPDR